jgi:hypothetical protein
MLKSLWSKPTETGDPIVKAKRKQTSRSIEDTMSDFPRQINDRTIQTEKKKLLPGGGPIKVTICREELQDTVRR